ncbi:MAG: methyltransferase domain-containing protein, partial [Candidatus Omnitrophica bacterium]|nr:methyltransferase domain-containing protein [Candidatus Omnitrophota bacterium]MBD3269757.1 methyltransferase domain-containing protein [Candidatus Omnitrophota bacterium]
MKNKEIADNHKRYIQRLERYKKFGYDTEKQRDFVVKKAHPFKEEVLEIGTGKGYFTLALARKKINLVSIDSSFEEQALALLNLKYCGLEDRIIFITADALRLCFKDESFNTVFCVNTAHHFKDYNPLFDELLRVVKKGGKLVLSDFNSRGSELIDKIHNSEGRRHFSHRVSL